MKTLEDLKNERDMLVNMRSGSLKKRIESQKLRSEIRELKYPETTRALRSMRQAGAMGFRTLGAGIKGTLIKQFNIGAEEKMKQQESARNKLKLSVRKQVLKDIKKRKPVKRKVKRRKR